MNKHDVKQREEVGYKDMEKFEDGGLEVEELLTNGYLLYVPYGIHCDIFEAIEDGIRAMQRLKDDLKKYHSGTEHDIIKENYMIQIKMLEKNIDVLTKIHGISSKI